MDNFSHSVIELYPGMVSYRYQLLEDLEITIRNVGRGRLLNISEIRFDYTPATDEEARDPGGPAMSLASPELPVGLPPYGEGEPSSLTFTIHSKRYNDCTNRPGTLTIVSDSDGEPDLRRLQILFAGYPRAVLVAPNDIRFSASCGNSCPDQKLVLSNSGTCDLVVSAIAFPGDSGFRVTIDGQTYLSGTDDGLPLDRSVVLRPEESTEWNIGFSSGEAVPLMRTAELGIVTTDPLANKFVVNLSADGSPH
jgi:hypothetical protein